jgi:hypothetical protein
VSAYALFDAFAGSAPVSHRMRDTVFG